MQAGTEYLLLLTHAEAVAWRGLTDRWCVGLAVCPQNKNPNGMLTCPDLQRGGEVHKRDHPMADGGWP